VQDQLFCSFGRLTVPYCAVDNGRPRERLASKHMGSRSKLTTAAGAALVVVAACSSPPIPTTSITVFASASLISTFSDIGKRFKSENPGASVQFIFADSLDLAEQLVTGDHADVFASADPANMRKVVQAGELAGGPMRFAARALVIVTAPNNPRGITSLTDLNRPGIRVAVCAPPGICAADTARIEASTGIVFDGVTQQSLASGVVTTVTSGQADAGLVYLPDALAAGDKVTSVGFPQAADAVSTYTIGQLKNSEQPELARRFIHLVTEDFGQGVLKHAGFQPVSTTS
jgi:molybdate transport system substrate-binding protein